MLAVGFRWSLVVPALAGLTSSSSVLPVVVGLNMSVRSHNFSLQFIYGFAMALPINVLGAINRTFFTFDFSSLSLHFHYVPTLF